MKWYKYICIICLLVPGIRTLTAQTTKVSGKIYELKDGVEIPAFVNVVFKEDLLTGTITDTAGEFSISTKKEVTAILIRGVGFKDLEYPIEKGENNKKLKIQVENNAYEIGVVTVKYKGNPAEKLIDSVIAHRKEIDYRRATSYQMKSYEKTKFSLYNVTEKFINSAFMKTFKEVFENPDTVDGKPHYAALLTETESDVYKKQGQLTNEMVNGVKMSGIENVNWSTMVATLYQDFNIYDDYQNVLGKIFMGPVNPIGKTYYKYFLTDTVKINGQTCYKIELEPRLFTELIYTGAIWIADSTFAVVKTDLKMDKNANINLVANFSVKSEYQQADSSKFYTLSKEEVTLDINPTDFISFSMNLGPKNEKYRIAILKTNYYNNYILNQPPGPQFPKVAGDVTLADTVEHDEEWWKTHRPDTLTAKEQKIYDNAEKIKQKPFFKFMYKVGDLIGSGYLNLDYVGIGPLYEMYSKNDIEGDRIKFGIRTGDKISKRFIAEGFIGYGFGDKRIKWQAFVNFHINKRKNPWRMISVMGRQGIEQIGLNPGQFRPDNIIGTFLRRRSLRTLSYINQVQLVYEHDWFTGFSQKLTVDWQQVFDTGTLRFPLLDQNTGLVSGYLPMYTRTEIRLETRLALGEKNITGRAKRRPIRGKFPEIKFTYAVGIKGFLGADYTYHTLRLSAKDIIRLKPLGYGEYVLTAGKTFGTVPYPLLEVHPGNDTYAYDKYAFNCMNYFEFVSDQFISFSYEHHFEGFFFNKIPGFSKLKWREVVGIRGVWGSLSEQNRRFMALPPGTYDLRDQLTGKNIPYMEMNVGIENIFNIIRIDFVYRLTHQKQANPNEPGKFLYGDAFNWGIFGSFNFDF